MIFIQNKRFHGRQEFRLQDDGELRVTFQNGSTERSYTVPLDQIDPNFTRVRQGAYGFLFAAYPTGLFAAGMAIGGVAGHDPAALIQGIIVGAIFGGISFACFRENARKKANFVAFTNRYNGRVVLTPWCDNPNPAAFQAFMEELAARIKQATLLGGSGVSPGGSTMAGEIVSLKKLLDEGVISAADFSRAKDKLLATYGERRPIGFGG